MRVSSRSIVVLVGVVLLASAVAVLMADSDLQPDSHPDLKSVDCWFPSPADFSASCYQMRVLESRSNSKSIYIEIPVVILSMPEKRRRDDRIIYLAGGPGDGAWIDADRIDFWWGFIRQNSWLSQRDLVLVDQRGTGNVSPRMDCPEVEALAMSFLALGRETAAWTQKLVEAAEVCYQRIRREGHEPAAYTTAESARDLHDVYEALGGKKWNVYGLSYGTRLALSYLREFPDDFRAVILDSTDPPQIDFHGDDAWRTQRAFDTALDACDRDAACRSWYPNLRRRLLALIDRLNRSPIDFDLKRAGALDNVKLRLTGDLLLSYLFLNLYNRADIERVPLIIDVFDRGQAQAMEAEIRQLVYLWVERPDWGEALGLTIDCAEEKPFTDAAAALNAYRGFPMLRSFAEGSPPFAACASWPVHAAEASTRQLVQSAVPALVLAGTFDPVSPPDYGRQTAMALTNSWFFEFNGVGHDVLGNEPCAGRLAAMFLDDPTRAPNDPCLQLQHSPRFLPPLE